MLFFCKKTHFYKTFAQNTFMKKIFCFLCIFSMTLFCAIHCLPIHQGFCLDSYSLPIVMYHSILNSKQGTYIVSKSQLEQDLLAIKQNGYTPVFPSQVIDFVYNKTPLPKNPIMLTFDDGFYNNLYYGLEILKSQNVKANINIIGKICDDYTKSDSSNPNYSYLTWQQVKTLADSGCFEIGNHTFDMHNFSPRYGIGQRCCESDQQYTQNLNNDIDLFETALKLNTNLSTNVFAYPFGKYNALSQDILTNRGYKLILTCEERANKILYNHPECLFNLGRINRSGNLSTATLIQKIKYCT